MTAADEFGDLHAIGDVELGARPVDMSLDRAHGHVQPVGDLLVAHHPAATRLAISRSRAVSGSGWASGHQRRSPRTAALRGQPVGQRRRVATDAARAPFSACTTLAWADASAAASFVTELFELVAHRIEGASISVGNPRACRAYTR